MQTERTLWGWTFYPLFGAAECVGVQGTTNSKELVTTTRWYRCLANGFLTLCHINVVKKDFILNVRSLPKDSFEKGHLAGSFSWASAFSSAVSNRPHVKKRAYIYIFIYTYMCIYIYICRWVPLPGKEEVCIRFIYKYMHINVYNIYINEYFIWSFKFLSFRDLSNAYAIISSSKIIIFI